MREPRLLLLPSEEALIEEKKLVVDAALRKVELMNRLVAGRVYLAV